MFSFVVKSSNRTKDKNPILSKNKNEILPICDNLSSDTIKTEKDENESPQNSNSMFSFVVKSSNRTKDKTPIISENKNGIIPIYNNVSSDTLKPEISVIESPEN